MHCFSNVPATRRAFLPLTVVAALTLGVASGARASWTLPDARPSTIQSYIDDPTKCPEAAAGGGTAVGCHIVLPCGEWVDDLPGHQITINNRQNIRITGCGMNGTTVKFTDPPAGGKLLVITGGSRWITIEDVKLEIDCSADCSGNATFAGFVDNGSADIMFERVHFHAADRSSSSAFAPFPGGLLLGTGATPVERVTAHNCNFHATGYGLSSTKCEDCWFNASWFGPITDHSRPVYALANKATGFGVRFTNNTFDMGGNVQSGLVLRSQTSPSVLHTAATAQIIGNSFVNLRDGWTGPGGSNAQLAIYMYGYNRANISNNLFACEPEPNNAEYGCTANGIAFIAGTGNCGTSDVCNEQNLMSGNVFDHVVDSGATCPIWFGASAALNRNNVIHGNVFELGSGSAAGANGICGVNEPLNPDVADNRAF